MMSGISTPGMILGTVAYMSPEQAAGQAVDKRADISAFGVVLYEMLTGKRLFQSESTAHLLADVLRAPIDLEKLPNQTPRTVRHLLKRCLDRDVRNRLRDIGEARVAIDSVAPQGDHLAAPSPSRLGSSPWIAAGVVLAIGCVVAAAGWYRATRPAPETPPWALTRLTSDPGLSGSPALSPDGKLVAYSSDRSLDGAQDLYIKQVAGGEPVRLTFDGAGNTTPDFSPDGSKIVFRSNRNGGGIYEIPAFSGDARLLARDGLNPKYSPDGSQVAYWVGEQGVSAMVPGGGTVWVVLAAGGQPQKVGPNFTAARYPIWSLDGKRLLIVGYTSARAGEASSLDWWLVAPNGGDGVKTGAQDALLRGALPGGATVAAIAQIEHKPGCWSAGNNVILSKLNGDTSNLLEIGISPRTGKVTEAPKNLTTGAGNEVEPACTPVGALAFTNVETRGEIWSLPFDMDHGTAKGVLERITQGPAFREGPSLSNDGRNVAFASNQSGLGNIWARDLATGKESSVARSAFRQRFPVSNASGDRIAFSVYEKEKRAVYLSTPGGTPEKLCEGCLRATAWSRDEKTLLIFGGNPYQVNLLDIAAHRQTPLLKHPAWALLYGRYSPDNRWVSFTARTESNHGRVAIAPVDGPKPVPESAWITIAEEGPEDFANWSPDGKTLYFTSARDGHYCLWGQRIDPSSHQLVGEAFAAEHLHGRLSYQQGGWSVSSGGIALGLTEQTGNIWTMTRSSAR